MAETQITETRIDIADRLALHSSDHPGIILVSKLLEGDNYGQWSRAMRISLSAKNKIGFIDGTMETPKIADAKYPIWKRCNDMVLSWILNSVDPNIANIIMYAETATDVWNDLKDRFSQGNDSRIYQIRQEIVEHQQGQQSVSIYYTKMKALWDELASYHDPLLCTCGGLKNLGEREEKEKVMQFLMGLNESYAAIRGSILMMNPFQNTRKVHALALQQERQVDVASRRELNSGIHAMQISHQASQTGQYNRHYVPQGNGAPKRQLKCSHCDMDGHFIDRCFYIHGFTVRHNSMERT